MFALHKKAFLLLVCCAFLINASKNASAAIIPLTPLFTLDQVINTQGNQLIVGDKIFTEFAMIGSSSGGAITPSLLTFEVQGVYDNVLNQYGLLFNPNMGAASGQMADARLSFKITVDPNFPLVIDGAILSMTGASASGNGQVHIAETIFPTSSPLNALASLDAFKDALSPPSALQDSATWNPGVSPVYVRKDIFVTGGQLGGAHLTEFFQFYHQAPEPSTIGFGIISMIGVCVYMNRRKNQNAQSTIDA